MLTFNGSANTWANPPEGVYVLNYSEIGSFTDIDVDRMKTQPTFVRIDAAQSITIKTSLTNTITIPLEIGTMMRLVEQSTAWAVFVAEKVQYYPTGTNNAAFGARTCHVNILLRICKSDVSSTTKVFSCYGDIEDTFGLFNESSMPCTMHYQNARGADLDTGNVFTQYTGRATAVQFNSASGKYRRNLLMPEEIQSHDFSKDETPEQIQFMGWGATSNRAGYKTINEVPTSAAGDSGKVLTVAANGTPVWGNGTPPVTLYHHWEKVNGDYDDNTEYLDFDVSSSGIKSAIVVIQMSMNAGKYVFFNVEGINMSNSTFGGTENYAHNNSDFNGIKPSVTNIMDYQYSGIKAIRIKHHGSRQHKFSTETSGIDIKVIGFK